jgi:polyphosphate kinase
LFRDKKVVGVFVRFSCAAGNRRKKILGGISAQQLVKDITEIVIEHQTESL